MKCFLSQGIKRDAGNHVTCRVCKNKLQLAVAAVEGLPNNLYAIHFVNVETEKKSGQYGHSTANFIQWLFLQYFKLIQELVPDV